MIQLEKHVYCPALFERLCPVLRKCIPAFDSREFIFSIFDNAWPDLSYFERTRKISRALHRFMPAHFPDAALLLAKVSSALQGENAEQEYAFLTDYIGVFGSEFPRESSVALAEISRNSIQRLSERAEIIQ